MFFSIVYVRFVSVSLAEYQQALKYFYRPPLGLLVLETPIHAAIL